MASDESTYWIDAGVGIRAQTFGDHGDPAILLVHGAGASMLWWQKELCEQIAAAGRFVIRYDQRDTGRSTTYPVGSPGYSLADLTSDAMGLLDAFEVRRAHIVGRSMSGAVAIAAGVDYPDRVASLTLVSTTSGDLPAGDVNMPERPDLTNHEQAVQYLVEVMRAYSGSSPHFDETATRNLAVQDVLRTVDLTAALTNHFLIEFDAPRAGGIGDISVPTLVIQGERDPIFPPPHGAALRDAIPGAELLILAESGHDVEEPVWDEFTSAVIRHTAS